MEVNVDVNESPFARSPVKPSMLEADKKIQFQCRKGISCWNACCANIDITLTPYDVLRLKKRMGLSAAEFLQQYTVPFEMEKDGLAGVKFRPVDEGTACRYMRPEGCSVYEDRPTACRYYPIALLSMRKQGENFDRDAYALVTEPHCKGHFEEREITIADYRAEQGVSEYDELARGWRQLILKKKSSGPAIGALPLKSRQFFFMACYDLDTFKAFVSSGGFVDTYDIPEAEYQAMLNDDVALLQFAFKLLRQVLFNEQAIPLRSDAAERREARRKMLAGEEG